MRKRKRRTQDPEYAGIGYIVKGFTIPSLVADMREWDPALTTPLPGEEDIPLFPSRPESRVGMGRRTGDETV